MKKSAGILLYRGTKSKLEFFLVHPGGPFWAKKDFGSWSIPKGEYSDDENPLQAALREFEEETRTHLDPSNAIGLTPVTQKGGKVIVAWALKGDLNASEIVSNTFEIEWPPKSGNKETYPEIDKGDWFDAEEAKLKINPAQAALIDEALGKVNG